LGRAGWITPTLFPRSWKATASRFKGSKNAIGIDPQQVLACWEIRAMEFSQNDEPSEGSAIGLLQVVSRHNHAMVAAQQR
jgi:hypothetical protein